jgi:hypothetical protein
VFELKTRIDGNDDPEMKQKKCRKGLRRELALCIERIPADPPNFKSSLMMKQQIIIFHARNANGNFKLPSQ